MQEKAIVGGKYELAKLIGRGGMGSVWEGRHVSLGSRVAIKFIEAAYAKSEEARSRFDREAHAAASIRSKHAIQIFDHGVTDDGHPYIVMELLEGESLGARLDRCVRISLADTARILRQIGRALTRAHEAGIVHRDLKPENVFLVRDTENPDEAEIAKVLDFGIAKIQPGAVPGGLGVTSSSTRTGMVIGTPHYMSPEQARGLRSVDHRTDVWALGAIAYRCVTGHLAFDGETIGDLLVRVCTDALPVPSHVAPQLPTAFDAWLARALDRNVETRFGSVRELCDALDTIVTSGAMPSLRPSSLANAETMAARSSSPSPIISPTPSLPSPAISTNDAPIPQAATSVAPFTASLSASQVALPLAKPRNIALRVALGVVPLLLVVCGAVATMRPKHEAAHATATAPPPAASTLPARPTTPATSTTTVTPSEVRTPMRGPERPARRYRKPFDPRDPGY